MFSHLQERWRDLFEARFEVLLYDLTSTYFECDPPESGKRKHGHSRDHRPDCTRTIAGMILQQALGLGLIGFVVGKTAATFWAPIFPKYVLLLPGDAARGFAIVMVICALASLLAIRAALRVDPAGAIGG